MPVIAISRGTLAGATALAEGVAARLQIPCIDRDVITKEAAKAAGVSEETLIRQMERPPSFFNPGARERAIYLSHVRAALSQHLVRGSFVYHGNGARFLLSDIPNLLRVGVVAPMEFRVAAVMRSEGLDAVAAEIHVRRMDKHRKKWVRFLYGVDWQDPAYYDLIVNLEKISVEEGCDLVSQVAQLERFKRTPQAQQKAADVALVARVTVVLARSGELFAGRLQLTAVDNILTIRGPARSKRALNDVRAAAEKVIGDADLSFEVTLSGHDSGWGFERAPD